MARYRRSAVQCYVLFNLVFVGFAYQRQELSYLEDDQTRGLFPNVFNLAATSTITVNATCGETGPEVYCKLVEHVLIRENEISGIGQESPEQCGVCDARPADKKHPIDNAIDGTNRWWQSPTLQNGKQYEWVTITLDLKQMFQIAYVIVKAAISPRPGNWILERSLDGIIYKPWQYYALTDTECWESYGIRPTVGKPHYRTDDEVICTSYYSKLNPLENGEIHTSLINGRPGVDGPSIKLMEFTKARYVRLRLQKIRTLHADLMTMRTGLENIDKLVTRRYFYSIKDISVGGQCACSGHAATCSLEPSTGKQQCQCEHNTCGENCDKCCPLYNQKPWNHGTSNSAGVCEKCECYGHSDKCHYEQVVADKKLSINTLGKYEGGGVCDKCKHHTTGINCEQCEDGYFRPLNTLRNHTRPCRKCQCSGAGMTGLCVKDDSHLKEGLQPGDCFCKVGFAGINCDSCDIGYRNYPRCEPCPCHSAGTVGGTICDGECICKTHVEGNRCDRCKQGFYHLSAGNPDGCSQCFCFGITDECTEADWGVNIVQNIEDWRVTDLKGSRVVKPTPENGNVVIANDEVSNFNTYYWLAPPDYLGKKLYSYGSDLKFTLSYVVARGDTSGTYTENEDVVLEGNGQQIGYNWGKRTEFDEVAISVPLREQGWFLLTPRDDGTNSVSREDFTLILNNLTKLLIRAKFHTDQIVGRLHNVGMELAASESKSIRKLGSVEKCVCPQGYTGLSCELCAPGYRSLTGPKIGHVCERCDCYNHAESCDNPEGRCEKCLHHTTGLKCDRCVRGYYGDATIGTPDDCKPCACPLESPENNFSPSCTAITTATGESDYICDQCPEGYEGNKCERCSNGYFGNPQIPGGYCQKCDCSGNADTFASDWCDSLTGQCLKCLGNTGGWNCGECLPEHYGDAELRNCQACNCNPHGSMSSQCDLTTGQCVCKLGVTGRTCNRCADGFGNLEAGCVPCKCNIIGSHSEVCDSVTGHCNCKPGVFGTTCDSCLEGHFGFSRQGCQECRCNHLGSISLQCDENNGQCLCKPRVTGRMCDRCEDGYWNLQSGNGCEECHCNRTGSMATICDKNTGQCNCKPGVGGQFCDQCLPGYFMFSPQGCRRCDPCDRPGHICDPNNGRCVCPPYTTGQRCQKCVRNAWGYHPINGCKPCNCNLQGSPQQNCDSNTGNCICLEGFEGRHCDQCRHGFYGFPQCKKCDCNSDGTIESHCRDNVCQCNSRGDCPCKELVRGQKCNQCVDGAFGLTAESSKGCYECFCFGKTRVCNQASMYWTKIILPPRDIFMEIGATEIPSILGFQTFPEDLTIKRMGIPYVLDKPMYWSLQRDQLGDKVLSYNGFLTFNAESRSSSEFPEKLLERYPLLVLQGNQRIVLVHSYSKSDLRMPYKVKFHEDEWRNFDNPLIPVTKTVLMVALQNLQYLLIRGTNGADVKYARLHNISLDSAASEQSQALAKGVEMCRCPRQYVGTSCQDPAPGYYRKRKPNYLNSKDVLDLVGWAEPCECNNHSSLCDKETGICINCGGNTMRDHCEQCKKGFYGDPKRGPCRPCACPHPSNSFSDTCVPDALDYVCINCQQGYTGRHCERCDTGFYGDLSRENGKCLPCNCNPYGSVRRECDPITGQCQCNEGVGGRDCTICSHGFILTEYGCKSCEDECTGILLKELYEMQLKVDNTNFTDLPRLPWGYLDKMLKEEQRLKPLVDDYQKNISMGKDLVDKFTFYLDLEAKADMQLVKAKEYINRAKSVSSDAKDTYNEAEKLLEEIQKISQNLRDLVKDLNSQNNGTGPSVSLERILNEAERILREIKARDFGPDKENAERELRKAQNLLNNVKKLTLDRDRVDDLKDRMDKLDTLLADLIRKIDEKVRKPVERTLETYQAGQARKNEVQAIVAEIFGFVDSSNKTLMEADELLILANGALIDAAVKFEYLPRYLRDLSNATNRLEEYRGKLSDLNPKYKEKYVIPAQRHADELERQSEHLASLFLATKELSEFPLQAAKAYQNIIDAILAAELAAEEAEKAAENAYRQAYPETDDALVDKADRARTKSLELLNEAQKLNDEKVPELEGELRARKKALDDLSEDLASGKRSNDIINRELDALPTGLRRSLEDTADKARVADEKAKGANRKADILLKKLDDDLIPKFDSIRAGTVGGLENLTRIIQKAREDTANASRLADRADESSRRVRKQHELTQLNLKELREKILLARQKASSIRVGLTADRNGQCVRSFSPIVEPSTTNNIIINYAIKSDARDSMLFFIGSAKEEDFMAIEMVNRKIRFLWNVGGGTQVITHEKEIETNNEQLLKNEQWFKIEANRIGNIGTLSVKRTPDGQKPDPLEVSGASPVGYTKMDLDSSSHFFIGGFPDNFLPPSELKTSSFAGCLYEALFDGKPIGLWNFKSSVGCDGCKEGATEDIDISAFEFQGGNSYAIVPQIPYYKKSDMYAVLSFKTLNEDALLLLSCNFRNGQWISLELIGGKVVYQLKLDGKTHIRIETRKKYNTGQWIRVEAAREKFEAQILVEDEFLEETSAKGSSSALDLKESSLYYGGVPPNFTEESWPGITFNNFFGCMKDLQIDSTPIDLFRGSFYGMNVGCSNRPMKVATFKGAGYLELNGQSFLSDSSISFSFMTNQHDGLLLLSTFVGQENSNQELLQTYYSIALKEGRIIAKFSSGGGELLLTSSRIIRSTTFHTVNIIRKNRRLLLRLDDEEEADIRLPKGAKDIVSPTKGGLFFGGVKRGINVGGMAASQQPFVGIIQDAVFNDKLLRFENTISHKGVDFGLPDIQDIMEESFQQMPPSIAEESCSSSIHIDEDAFSLQSPKSLEIPLNKKTVVNNFNISLNYRTFYPDGNILTLSNEQRKLHLSVHLTKGLISVNYLRKQEHKIEKSIKELSIGKWHKVEVVKQGKQLAIFLDRTKSMGMSISKRTPFKKILLGGPSFTSDASNEIQESFKGCMQAFHINGIQRKIPSSSPCFKHVEFGAYFTGIGHIVQDLAYHMGNKINLSFQFRATEFDGILFSIFSRFTGVWFEICLQKNMIVATTHNNNTEFQLSREVKTHGDCSYAWHSVEMAYHDNTFVLNVDDYKPAERKLKHIPEDFGFSEIYIGGKPEKYQKSGCINNFSGCLRKVILNGEGLQIKNSAAIEENTVQFMCPQM